MPSTKQRQNSCSAPGCKTGLIRVKGVKTASLFGVPKDRAKRDLWEKNLQRSDKRLEETSAVCELHFEPRFILRDYVHIIGGKEVRIPRGHPALTPDAVPTLLPSVPQDLNDDLPAGREERKQKAGSPEPIVAERSGLARETDPLSPVVNSEAPAVTPQGIDRDALGSLNVPTPYWAVHKFCNFDGVAYLKTALEPKSNKISIERAVFFCSDNLPDVVCQVYLQGHFVDDTVVRTTHEAEEALRRAASLPLCGGALSSTEISTADLTEGLKRKLCNQEDVIYSNECSGRGITRDGRCLQCRYLRKVLLTRKSWLSRKKPCKTKTPAQKLRASLQRSMRLKRKLCSSCTWQWDAKETC
ncbi:uncharacterized protein ISCGN_013197 [Ixodes scapularis]